jgi:hypothetical protein
MAERLMVLTFAIIVGAIVTLAVRMFLGELSMNGPLISAIGTLAALVAGALISWMAKNNLVPASQVDAVTAALVVVITAAFGALLVIVKAWMARLQAHIAAVNNSGVVKTVDANAAAPMLAAPPTPDQAKIAAVNAIDGVKVVPQSAPTAQVNAVPPILK